MTRTKIEQYIYSVLDKGTMTFIGSFKTTEELRSMKSKKEAAVSSGYPEDSIVVLTDTECGVYEMSDDFFFANATRKQ